MNPSQEASVGPAVSDRVDALDEKRRAGMFRRRALVEPRGRALALGIALRHVRTAQTQQQLLAAIEEILVQHVGVEAFAVLHAEHPSALAVVARGVPASRALRDAVPMSEGSHEPPIAWIELGFGAWAFGALVLYRLMPGKLGLDSFDHDLLAAMGSQIAVALHTVRSGANSVRCPTLAPRHA